MSFFLKKTIYLFLILVVFLTISNVVFSQESISDSLSSMNLIVSPLHPRPGDTVSLTATSDLIDLNSSKIVWYIDGVARKETTNKTITIKAKNDGQKTIIRLVIETVDGVIRETSSEIYPGGVDLIIEPITYIPPFYKGKPLFVPQSNIKITAIPDVVIDGLKVVAKNLNFKWIQDGNVLGESSGKGHNQIIINSIIPVRDINIGIQILDDLNNILAENSQTIIKKQPGIVFYENSPLYGILYNKAIKNNYFMGTKEELMIIAKPFYFSFLNDTADNASYTWSINNDQVSQEWTPNEITLRQNTQETTNIKSNAYISLDIKNINKITQYISDGFNIEFGQ